MQFQKHFKSASPISLLLAQIVTSVFGIFLLFECLYSFDEYNFISFALLVLIFTATTCVTPLINRAIEKGGYIQKIWNTAEVLVVQSVCSAFFVWQHCKVYFRPPDASWLGDALVTLIPMIIGLSNVLAMLIQIAIYTILHHRKTRRTALTQPQPTPPIEP
jgi:uncharacterized membrane protein